MTDHELRELLLQADEAAWLGKSSQLDVDTAAIRQRVRRRSLRNRAIVAGTVIVACMIALIALTGRNTSDGQPESSFAHDATLSPREIDSLKSQIAALDAEARSAKAIVDRLRHADRLALLTAESGMQPISSIDSTPVEQIERAAGIGVTSADFLADELNRRQEATESYRAVLKHFPGSQWASVARERLLQMDMMN